MRASLIFASVAARSPLVMKFARQCRVFEAPSLLELAGRAVRAAHIEYHVSGLLPTALVTFLDSAHECVNPNCRGTRSCLRIYLMHIVSA